MIIFGATFDHFLKQVVFFEAVTKIGSSLKSNYQMKLNLAKSLTVTLQDKGSNFVKEILHCHSYSTERKDN